MNWEKYYKEFYSLSGSNQYYYAQKLLNYGTNEQVIEIAKNFKLKNVNQASIFLKKALLSGIKFMPYQIIECKDVISKEVLQLMAVEVIVPYTAEQLHLIQPYINRKTFHSISKINEKDLPNMKYLLDTTNKDKPSLLTSLGLAMWGVKLFDVLTDNDKDK